MLTTNLGFKLANQFNMSIVLLSSYFLLIGWNLFRNHLSWGLCQQLLCWRNTEEIISLLTREGYFHLLSRRCSEFIIFGKLFSVTCTISLLSVLFIPWNCSVIHYTDLSNNSKLKLKPSAVMSWLADPLLKIDWIYL